MYYCKSREIFKKYNVPKEPDYISIDVDSSDLWLFKSILKEYDPLVVSVEFNLNIPINYSITFPDDTEESWQGDRIFGASLKALNKVANSYNYTLVYAGEYLVSNHHDAFFIRNDQLTGLSSLPLDNFAHTHLTKPIHPACVSDRYKIMLDYEEYELTGDVEKSRAKAEPICKQYLAQQ